MKQLLEIKQTSSIDEYLDKFEDMITTTRDIAVNILESTFLKGLHLDIQTKKNLFHLKELTSIMRITKDVELKINQIIEFNELRSKGENKQNLLSMIHHFHNIIRSTTHHRIEQIH